MAIWDVISMNHTVTNFVRDGLSGQALAVYRWMVASGIRETPHTFSVVLGACSTRKGLQLHGRVLSMGLCSNLFVGSALVNHYISIQSPRAALMMYDVVLLCSASLCNVVLHGLCNLKLTEELLCSFLDMRQQGLELNGLSYFYALKGCHQDQDEEWLEQGRKLHGVVLKAGWVPSNIFLSNSLVDLYSKIGDLVDAKSSLNDIPSEDVISWNSIISVYAGNGYMKEAIDYLSHMLWRWKMPSVHPIIGLLALSG